MQDAWVVSQLIENQVFLFGIFDGHGGPEVAQFVAKYLPKQLVNQPYFKLHNYPKALKNTFKRVQEMLASGKGQSQLKKLSQKATVKAQRQPKQRVSCKTGTTANVVLITKDKIYCANIGDSRSVLCRKGKAFALSEDHKPNNQKEKDRILKAGARVVQGRINNGLNMSRAFGDFHYKNVAKLAPEQQAIICIPQIKEIQRSKDDQFIIIGCDGIWQRYVNNNQQMIEKITNLNVHYNQQSKACRKKSYNIQQKTLASKNTLFTSNNPQGQQESRNRKKSAYMLAPPKLQTKQQFLFEDLFTQLLGVSTEKQIGCDNMTAILIEFSYQF